MVCGDIVGKSGRNSIKRELPNLINDKNLDFVLVNGENSANGFGITKKYVKNYIRMALMLLRLEIIYGIKRNN